MRCVVAAVPVALLVTACTGAPMRASSAATLTPTAPAGAVRTTDGATGRTRPDQSADVRFVHRLLAHHSQALRMTALVRTQSTRSDVRILALRTELSQRDELALMRHWLETHADPVPPTQSRRDRKAADAAASAVAAQVAATPMPGMLGAAQLDSLSTATGPAFDALFLRYMIAHDAGALAMVNEHLAAPGAALQPETRRLLMDFDAERRAELHRYRTLLADVRN